jgi:hypothetical protein
MLLKSHELLCYAPPNDDGSSFFSSFYLLSYLRLFSKFGGKGVGGRGRETERERERSSALFI